MEKLQLKHLAPYLPYGVKVKIDKWIEEIGSVQGFDGVLEDVRLTLIIRRNKAKTEAITWTPLLKDCKPILRPLSRELLKEIFSDYSEFEIIFFNDTAIKIQFKWMGEWCDVWIKTSGSFDNCYKWVLDLLFEHHVDVFGLIDKGLAIDKNTLKDM